MKKVAWRGDESVWRNFGVARTWNAYWCNPNQTLKIILKSNPNPEPVSIMIKKIKNSTFNEQINILSTHSLLSYSLYDMSVIVNVFKTALFSEITVKG